ncbi:MAG: hypothetical protein GY851_03455 [bacterium]|nr:hypothetical protein [bacterium]
MRPPQILSTHQNALDRPATPSDEAQREEEEWASGRYQAIPPMPLTIAEEDDCCCMVASWPTWDITNSSETDTGTFYTDWHTLTNGPIARGWFSICDPYLAQNGVGVLNAWIELAEADDTLIEAIQVGGLVQTAGTRITKSANTSGLLIFAARTTTVIGRIRWRVECSGGTATISLNSDWPFVQMVGL